MVSRLLFDLDNTLYPESSGFESMIVSRMTSFAARWLGVGLSEAARLRDEGLSRHGTTLEWLMAEHGYQDVEGYYASAHPQGEEEILSPDPALDALLEGVDMPKAIFTNAPREHAERVLERLGIRRHFERVWDIRFCGMRGKPRRGAFEAVLADWGARAAETAFFDDSPRSLLSYRDLGGRAVLVDESGRHRDCGLPAIPSIHAFPSCLD